MIKCPNEKAFTLVEVVASLVLLSIILLSFFQIFIQTNKTANINNEKLAVINLADATLERIKATPLIEDTSINNLNSYFSDNSKFPKKYPVDNPKYDITYSASQNTVAPTNGTYSEKQLGLLKVKITVKVINGTTKGSTEGFVSIEKNTTQ